MELNEALTWRYAVKTFSDREVDKDKIARALMRLLLGRGVERGAAYVTLQASVEGEPLYRSMNFDAQFRICNYV